MMEALDHLIELINMGYEYPDAHCKAVKKFKVDPDELQSLYDTDRHKETR
jgi:hypothetical protein